VIIIKEGQLKVKAPEKSCSSATVYVEIQNDFYLFIYLFILRIQFPLYVNSYRRTVQPMNSVEEDE